MTVEHQLVSELKDQLKNDTLYYAWMIQIARLQKPDYTDSDCIDAVLESVGTLHRTGDIVVGSARNSGGMVIIDPWPEVGENLQNRMASAIENSNGDDRAFCFWIQLTVHFAR